MDVLVNNALQHLSADLPVNSALQHQSRNAEKSEIAASSDVVHAEVAEVADEPY